MLALLPPRASLSHTGTRYWPQRGEVVGWLLAFVRCSQQSRARPLRHHCAVGLASGSWSRCGSTAPDCCLCTESSAARGTRMLQFMLNQGRLPRHSLRAEWDSSCRCILPGIPGTPRRCGAGCASDALRGRMSVEYPRTCFRVNQDSTHNTTDGDDSFHLAKLATPSTAYTLAKEPREGSIETRCR